MTMTKHISIGVVLASLAACGGGGPSSEDFVGVYQMSSHRENHGQGVYVPCDDPGSEIPDTNPSYAPNFAIIVDPFFNDPNFLAFQTCSSPDLASCVDTLISLSPGGDGLEDLSANTQSGGGTNCNLYAGRSSAVLQDTTVTVDDRHWDEFDHVGSCELRDAEALRNNADCRDVVVWVGTKL